MEELEEKLHEKEIEYGRLAKRVKTMERDNDSLQAATHKYEQQNRDLEREVSYVNFRIFMVFLRSDYLNAQSYWYLPSM